MVLFLTDTTEGPYATLTPDESKHAIRVLRLTAADEIFVTSGDGTLCRARITLPDPSACTSPWLPPKTTLAWNGLSRKPSK